MSNPLIRKLEVFAALSTEDRRVLESLSKDAREYSAGEDLIEEGDRADCVFL